MNNPTAVIRSHEDDTAEDGWRFEVIVDDVATPVKHLGAAYDDSAEVFVTADLDGIYLTPFGVFDGPTLEDNDPPPYQGERCRYQVPGMAYGQAPAADAYRSVMCWAFILTPRQLTH